MRTRIRRAAYHQILRTEPRLKLIGRLLCLLALYDIKNVVTADRVMAETFHGFDPHPRVGLGKLVPS